MHGASMDMGDFKEVRTPPDEKVIPSAMSEKPWMKSFGQLRSLREESARINEIIKEEFEQVEPEDLL